MEAEIIYSSDPYYTCPLCGDGHITKAFQRCVNCGARIKWIREGHDGRDSV